MRTVYITGTDTDVGKTWIAAAVIRQLRTEGIRVGAYKPVCSGAVFDADDQDAQERPHWHDITVLTEAADFNGDLAWICPQRFLAPLAPNVSARLEGRMVDDALLADGLRCWHGHADIVVVEGAGGLLSPLSDQSTNADLALRLQSPLILVAANRLGVLNHTALTVEVARQRGLNVAAVVLNTVDPRSNVPVPADHSAAEHNAAELTRLVQKVPLFACDFQHTNMWPVNDAARQHHSVAGVLRGA